MPFSARGCRSPVSVPNKENSGNSIRKHLNRDVAVVKGFHSAKRPSKPRPLSSLNRNNSIDRFETSYLGIRSPSSSVRFKKDVGSIKTVATPRDSKEQKRSGEIKVSAKGSSITINGLKKNCGLQTRSNNKNPSKHCCSDIRRKLERAPFGLASLRRGNSTGQRNHKSQPNKVQIDFCSSSVSAEGKDCCKFRSPFSLDGAYKGCIPKIDSKNSSVTLGDDLETVEDCTVIDDSGDLAEDLTPPNQISELVPNPSDNGKSTPPVQPSISPELYPQRNGRWSEDVRKCYGAGLIMGKVKDRRKCKPRGILIVGEAKPLPFDEERRFSLIPEPLTASVKWISPKAVRSPSTPNTLETPLGSVKCNREGPAGSASPQTIPSSSVSKYKIPQISPLSRFLDGEFSVGSKKISPSSSKNTLVENYVDSTPSPSHISDASDLRFLPFSWSPEMEIFWASPASGTVFGPRSHTGFTPELECFHVTPQSENVKICRGSPASCGFKFRLLLNSHSYSATGTNKFEVDGMCSSSMDNDDDLRVTSARKEENSTLIYNDMEPGAAFGSIEYMNDSLVKSSIPADSMVKSCISASPTATVEHKLGEDSKLSNDLGLTFWSSNQPCQGTQR